MTAEVVVAGTATTRFGRQPAADVVTLAVDAAHRALLDADVVPAQVDALYLGTFFGRSIQRRGVLASVVAHRMGLDARVATTVVEGACASGGIALRHGALACWAGAARVVLCVGVDQMCGVGTPAITAALGEAFDDEEREVGLTFPGFFGLVAAAYGDRYGLSREHLSAVPVKNRAHGATNAQAMYAASITEEDVRTSRLIADPLRLYDCAPVADGAAAAIVAVATDVGRRGRTVRLLASEQGSGPASVAALDDLASFPATKAAADAAYARAGVSAAELDVVELHDCFSIAEIVDSEDLGLVPRGSGAEAIASGSTRRGGHAALVNPSGGLLSRGHPVGATGLAQVHELVKQLRSEADVQADGARLALAHNLGGSGATATVTILAAA